MRRSSAGQRVFTKLLNYSSPVVATGSPLLSLPAKKFVVTSVTHLFFLATRLSSLVVKAVTDVSVESVVVDWDCARLFWRIDWAVMTDYAEVYDRFRGSFIFYWVTAALSYYISKRRLEVNNWCSAYSAGFDLTCASRAVVAKIVENVNLNIIFYSSFLVLSVIFKSN